MSIPDSHALRAFLLHRLSEAEARALEERLMQEDGFLEALQDAEHDLLDDYAHGRLHDEERVSVERHLLATPEARQRLQLTRALARGRGTSYSSQAVPPADKRAKSATPAHRRHRRTWQLALAAAASLAIVALVLPFRFQPGDSAERVEILLLAENQRGTPSQPIHVDEAATEVRLQVEIPVASQTATYGVDIVDPRGRSVYAANGLRVHEVSGYSVVDLIVPGRAFAAGPGTVILRELQQADPSASPVEVFRWQVQVNRR
jgi:hypothetical protein